MNQEAADQTTLNQKITPIIFQGKTTEYFGIWIVNLLLSLITFGIYSAWAKVRRKKYFYNNTLIDNVGFDYHAKPKAILKGRIIASIFFAAYGISANINPLLPFVFMLIFFIFLPWLVVRGSLFNARNTSHRGLRFDFVGTLRQAAKVFIGLPLLMLPTLGLIIPYAAHQKKQFSVNNHRFGLSPFEMQPKVKAFYKVYLITMILPLIAIIGIIAAIAIPAYHQYKVKVAAHASQTIPEVANFVEFKQEQPIVLAPNQTSAEEQVETPEEMPKAELSTVERIYSDQTPAESTAPEDQKLIQEKIESQIDAQEAMQVEEMRHEETQAEQPAPKAKNFEDLMRERQQARNEKMRDILKNPRKFLGSLLYILPALALYALFIFSFLGYMQARIGNLVWNNTTLDKLSFQSSLRARDFIWIYFTNIIAIMCTFGLATPWAQIRLAKYRTSKLQIVGNVDFDQFVGDKKAEVKATGEEIADMFDVDLSFG